mmetsp:Transcript_13387/g.14821  ORF Transcript_13387/g.14821 Transcript_13387/m.14821 type:complete len:183 (+) Transcript_13387:86-634(+)
MIATLQMAFGVDLRTSLFVSNTTKDSGEALAENCGIPQCRAKDFFSDSGWTIASTLQKYVVQPQKIPKYIEAIELSDTPWKKDTSEILMERGETIEGCLGVYNLTIQFGHSLGMICVSSDSSGEEDVQEDEDLFDKVEHVPSPRKLPRWMATASQENSKRPHEDNELETSRPKKRAKQEKDD